MGKDSGIAWCDHTFNPWWGCTPVSAGCKHCYAETFATVRLRLPIWGQNAARRFFGDAHWQEPVRWNKAAKRAGVPALVFCASMADVFEDRPDLTPHRARLFALIAATPWLIWLLLTKRPQNMPRLAPEAWRTAWPSNVWAGTTTESQTTAAERVPCLLEVPAAVRFLSVEPQLEPVDLNPPTCPDCGEHSFVLADDNATPWCGECETEMCFYAWLDACADERQAGISWVIQGGESGTGARPFDLAWARSLRDQCKSAGVPYFLKQLGARPQHGGHDFLPHERLTDSHGGNEKEYPVDLRGLRAFPARVAP